MFAKFKELISGWFNTIFSSKQDEMVASAPVNTTPKETLPSSAANSVKPENPKRRPVIGVSGSGVTSKSVISIMSQLRSAGADPVFITDHADRIAKNGGVDKAVAKDLERLDALVVMGNDGDIDPAKYHQPRGPHTKIETDLGRASYEETAITRALDHKIPLLGICGGLQRINVLGGGTLHQHVPDIVGDDHHMQGDIPPFVPVQAVSITQGTMLSDIAGPLKSVYTPAHQELPPGVVMENSFHHQAIKDVRSDFQVNAISSDGIIEGIEPKPGSRYANQFVLGVQWHPEFGASDLGPKIATNLVGAAKEFAQSKPQQAEIPSPEKVYIPIPGGAAERILKRRQEAVMMR